MSSSEMYELHEHAEHGKQHPETARVSLTMAMLAVVVAAVSLLGHRTHTEEVMLQNQVSDEWAHYQAKAIRLNTDQIFVDLTSVLTSRDAGQAAKLQEKYQKEVERYSEDKKELDAEARKLEDEVKLEHGRANRYDLGEVFVEIALVITSITLLSGGRGFWYAGMVIGIVGTVIVATGALIH